ncbi:hypothetical protein EV368DRAFT_66652 [Lentinula lateritia]|nr:hypothetical protein EV368DRAFT_66652 [Lentinula lateritia]
MSPFLSSTYCMFKYSHIANFPSALLLATGDIVMVLEQQPLGWWYGQLGKKRGRPRNLSLLSFSRTRCSEEATILWSFDIVIPSIILVAQFCLGHPFTTEDGICFLLPQRPSGWSYDERLRTPQNALSVNNEEEAQRPMAGNSKTMSAFKLPLITSSTSSVHNEQSLVRSSAYEGVMAQSMMISRLPTLDRLELMQSADVQSVEEVSESKPETTQFSSNRRPVQIMKSRARIDTNVLVSDSIKQAPAAFFNQGHELSIHGGAFNAIGRDSTTNTNSPTIIINFY